MTKKNIGFHNGKEEPISQKEFSKYIDKYVIFQTSNFNAVGKYIGTINDKEGTFAVLNPHLSFNVDSLRGQIEEIIEEDYEVSVGVIVGIKPTSRKNLENSVENSKMHAETNYLEWCIKTQALEEQMKKLKESK
ncbi:MAG: hypothetical protein AABX88_02145 [Nanoarchaeota archaeon]